MEQTLDISKALGPAETKAIAGLQPIFKDSRYGSLVLAPKILKQNTDDLDLLEIEYSALTKEIDDLKLTESDIKTLEDLNTQAINARKAIGDKYKAMNERRKPLTSWMSEVTAQYTAVENKAVALADKLKKFNNASEAEKSRRNDLARQEALQKQQEEQSRIEREAAEAVAAWSAYLTFRTQQETKFAAIYAAKSPAELPAYQLKLADWKPNCGFPGATDEMRTDYVNHMHLVKNGLLMGTYAATDVAAEVATVQQAVSAQAEQQQLEVAANVAVPVVAAARGTSKKKAYTISGIGDLQKLAVWWVETQLVDMDLEAAGKKLSFVVTAANAALNAGVTVSGVAIGDSFNTRA